MNKKNQKGFALLFAVLTSSVLLAIGVSIFNLTVKELALSASGRESQFSFYAADTGAECALYWDFKGTDVFATSTEGRTPSPSAPDCVDTQGQAAQTIDVTTFPTAIIAHTPTSATTRFSLSIPNTDINGLPAPYCATVTVTKTYNSSTGAIDTSIDSRGYNVGSISNGLCQSTDPNRVERALKVTY